MDCRLSLTFSNNKEAFEKIKVINHRVDYFYQCIQDIVSDYEVNLKIYESEVYCILILNFVKNLHISNNYVDYRYKRTFFDKLFLRNKKVFINLPRQKKKYFSKFVLLFKNKVYQHKEVCAGDLFLFAKDNDEFYKWADHVFDKIVFYLKKMYVDNNNAKEMCESDKLSVGDLK